MFIIEKVRNSNHLEILVKKPAKNNFLNDKWKKIIFFSIIVIAIEFSGHGIFASLFRLLSSGN